MWRMLQQDEPEDYVIATGETHTIREFLEEVFSYLDLDYHAYVETDPRFFRPTEVDVLVGDPTKAKRDLDWEPTVTFRDLARLMIEADMEVVEGAQP